MAIQVDILGSCVVKDVFRYMESGKYRVYKSLSNIPITSLYEAPIFVEKEKIESLDISNYDKVMLKVQMLRNLPEVLLHKHSDFLVIDLANELLKRCEIQGEKVSSLALGENQREALMSMFEKNSQYSIGKIYSILNMDIQYVDEKFRRFAKEILYSEVNPKGYQIDKIIVVEAFYTQDIVGSDGEIYKHDEKYRIQECNDWLKRVYSIFYKHFKGCQVIRIPEFTHSSSNHIEGINPLHYMQETYRYFEKALDIVTGYSRMNTLENLYNEQSLENRLKTRVLKSGDIYLLKGIKDDVEMLKKKHNKIDIDTFGSCVCRDVFRYTFPERYKVNTCIQRNPITTMYQKPIRMKELPEGVIPKYEKRMFDVTLKQNILSQLKESCSKILVLDLAEERLERWKAHFEENEIWLPITPKIKKMIDVLSNKGFQVVKQMSPFDLEEKDIRRTFLKFAQDIVWSEDNLGGYKEENIYVIETMFAPKIISNQGRVREYIGDYHVEQYNAWLRKLYNILYEYIPNCKKIKLPQYTYASENHLWGGHPLHYTDETYQYLAKVIDALNNVTMENKPENILKEQSLNNKLKTRVLNSEKIYQIDKMQKKIEALEKEIKELRNILMQNKI